MASNSEREERRMLPPPTLTSVEGVVTRIAAQILQRPHDGNNFYHGAAYEQQQQHHGYYSSFNKGPPEFGGIIPFIGRMLKLIILTSGLILVSAASYVMAYHYVLMPPRCATVPLFFECATTTAAANIHANTTPDDSHAIIEFPSRRFHFGHHHHQNREKQQQQQQQQQKTVDILPSSASLSSASAAVDLFARHDSWEAFHPSVIPQPVAQKRLLQSRQAYYIELSLILPASNRNQQGAGIFGVHTELRSSVNNTCLAQSRRSARFPHESAWIQVIRNIILLPALLVGAMEESRSVTVLAFRHFTESKDLPLQHVRVSIVPQSLPPAAWQQHEVTQTYSTMNAAAAAATVEITGGELRIGKELNRCQEILKGWYYSCFVVGTILFAGFYAKLWTLLMSFPKGPPVLDPIMEEEPPCDLDDMDFAEFEEAWEDTANFEDWGGGPAAPTQQQQQQQQSGGNHDESVEEVHEDEPPPAPEVPSSFSSSHRPPRRETSTSRVEQQQRRRPRHETSTRRRQSRYNESSESEGSWEDLYYPPPENGT